MSISQKIIDVIERRRDKQKKIGPGPAAQFWRDGGNKLLYDLPVTTGSLIIDAGGYHGDWSAQMISRYGCKSEIFEPVPKFFNYLNNIFEKNTMVKVHKAALGGRNRKTEFSLLDNGTSEHCGTIGTLNFQAEVIDVARIFSEEGARVACFKLNIEGGEYEVLERMIEIDTLAACDSLLIQFHRQPDGYESRYNRIISALNKTHVQIWCYEMVWEKWVLKGIG